MFALMAYAACDDLMTWGTIIQASGSSERTAELMVMMPMSIQGAS
jgi:hypothetical protein